MCNINQITRTTLYHGRYKYKVVTNDIVAIYNLRVYRTLESYKKATIQYFRVEDKNYPYEIVGKLIKFINKYQEKLTYDNEYRLVIGVKKITLFGNDLALINDFAAIKNFTIEEAIVVPDIKYFVNKPLHNYRMYLKSAYITEEYKNELLTYLIEQQQNRVFYPCDSLLFNLKRYPGTYALSSSSQFIDYDSESALTMFSLMFGDIVRKTFKLEKR